MLDLKIPKHNINQWQRVKDPSVLKSSDPAVQRTLDFAGRSCPRHMGNCGAEVAGFAVMDWKNLVCDRVLVTVCGEGHETMHAIIEMEDLPRGGERI